MSASYARLISSRALHVLDVENLLGGEISVDRVNRLWACYQHVVPVGDQDLVFAGFCPETAPCALELPRRVRLLVGSPGPNSADAALSGVLEPSFVSTRYRKVYLGSGDNWFTDAAQALRAAATPVVAVRGAALIAASLYLACVDSVLLPPLVTDAGLALAS